MQARAAVYPEAGLDPRTGAIIDCRKAGRVRVGVQWVSGGTAAITVLDWTGLYWTS